MECALDGSALVQMRLGAKLRYHATSLDILTIGNERVGRVRRWNGWRSSGGQPPSVAKDTIKKG